MSAIILSSCSDTFILQHSCCCLCLNGTEYERAITGETHQMYTPSLYACTVRLVSFMSEKTNTKLEPHRHTETAGLTKAAACTTHTHTHTIQEVANNESLVAKFRHSNTHLISTPRFNIFCKIIGIKY